MAAIGKIENSIFGSVLLSRLDVVKLFPKISKLVFHQKSGNDKNANLFLAKTRRKSDEIFSNEMKNDDETKNPIKILACISQNLYRLLQFDKNVNKLFCKEFNKCQKASEATPDAAEKRRLALRNIESPETGTKSGTFTAPLIV